MTMRGVKANFKRHFKHGEIKILLLCWYDHFFFNTVTLSEKRRGAGWQEDSVHKI